MLLKDYVKKYRAAHDLSQRQFATQCGLSNGYISMLENDLNPKTGLPLSPSIVALKKIANGMGITLNDLLSTVDDMAVDVTLLEDFSFEEPTPSHTISDAETEMLTKFRMLDDRDQQRILGRIDELLESEKYKQDIVPKKA